jgi:hypothetical protein
MDWVKPKRILVMENDIVEAIKNKEPVLENE